MALAFTGADAYDRYMGPVVFEPYAIDLASRLEIKPGMKVLEIAAGTGRLTRHLAKKLEGVGTLVATDLGEKMLETASSAIHGDHIVWSIADGQELPYPDNEFDFVFCQFGVMFFEDKLKGFQEAYRVLKPGGRYLFSVWLSHSENRWGQATHEVVTGLLPDNPPKFFILPFSYSDETEIKQTLEQARFSNVQFEIVRNELVTSNAEDVARGMVLGSPLRKDLEDRGITDVEPVIAAVAKEQESRFGTDPMRADMSALIISARK